MSHRLRNMAMAALAMLAHNAMATSDEGGRVSYPKSARLSRADVLEQERKREREAKRIKKARQRESRKV